MPDMPGSEPVGEPVMYISAWANRPQFTLPNYKAPPKDGDGTKERSSLYQFLDKWSKIEGHIYAISNQPGDPTVIKELIQDATLLGNDLAMFEAMIRFKRSDFPDDKVKNKKAQRLQVTVVRNPYTAQEQARTSFWNANVHLMRIMCGKGAQEHPVIKLESLDDDTKKMLKDYVSTYDEKTVRNHLAWGFKNLSTSLVPWNGVEDDENEENENENEKEESDDDDWLEAL